MGTFSIWHWLILFLVVGFWVLIGRYGYLIARRAGLSGWIGALVGVPLLNIIVLWYLALVRWPATTERRRS